MSNIINADEARRLAYARSQQPLAAELTEVMALIEKDINEGKFAAYIPKDKMCSATANHLRDTLHYKVRFIHNPVNGEMYEVCW